VAVAFGIHPLAHRVDDVEDGADGDGGEGHELRVRPFERVHSLAWGDRVGVNKAVKTSYKRQKGTMFENVALIREAEVDYLPCQSYFQLII
jgi:hypothetical protein